MGNWLLGDRAGTLRFARPERRPDVTQFSTELQARRAFAADVIRVPIDLRTLTYIPTVMFLALTLATRIWKSSRGVTVLVLGTMALGPPS